MEHSLAAEILHSARKVADQAEVFSVSSRETSVHFEANKLKQVQTKENTTIALRIFKGGRIGFAMVSGNPNVEALVNTAVETSQFGPAANFQLSSSKNCHEVNVLDPGVENIAMKEMAGLGYQLIARVREHNPNVICDVVVTRGRVSVHIVNSQGREVHYDKTPFSLSLEGVLVQDTDMLFVGDSESSCHLPASIDSLANDIVRQLDWAKEKASVPTKLLPVIFTPSGVASAFLIPLAFALNGRVVLEGASPLKDKLGEQLFDKRLSMWDDATIAYGLGSSPCDDEGVCSQRLPLISSGTVSNFLYDLQTAGLAGTQSTGHGRRMPGTGQIRPAISALVIDEGENPFESILEDVKKVWLWSSLLVPNRAMF